MSMKKSNDTIGNQTRDLPACSAVFYNNDNNNRRTKPAQITKIQVLPHTEQKYVRYEEWWLNVLYEEPGLEL